ncbi:hypothetical protein P7K49_040746, partial [Saguinus oedipus]
LSTKAFCFWCIFCIRSATCRNVELQSSVGSFLGSRETQGGEIVYEDFKEGPQLGVMIKDCFGIEVRGQQLHTDLCFGAFRGTVSLNAKDGG